MRIRDHTHTPGLAPTPCQLCPFYSQGPSSFIPNTSQLPSILLGDREREEEEEGRRQEEGWREVGK